MEFDNVLELEEFIRQWESQHYGASPIIAIVGGLGEATVYFGIGGALSFVSSCDPPYLTTVGDPNAEGEKDYFFQGHHSPIPTRNLVPCELAIKILCEFCQTNKLPSWHAWEPI